MIKFQEKKANNKVRELQAQVSLEHKLEELKEEDMHACVHDGGGVDGDQPCDEMIGEPVIDQNACLIAVQVCDKVFKSKF